LIPKIIQAKTLWSERGFLETGFHSELPKFLKFWDEEFQNLTFEEQDIILRHYISTEDIL